jgi:hypothetical protein
MKSGVFARRDKLKILNAIVRLVPIDVMDVHAIRNRAVMGRPYEPVFSCCGSAASRWSSRVSAVSHWINVTLPASWWLVSGRGSCRVKLLKVLLAVTESAMATAASVNVAVTRRKRRPSGVAMSAPSRVVHSAKATAVVFALATNYGAIRHPHHFTNCVGA